jgi:hypothetical protein
MPMAQSFALLRLQLAAMLPYNWELLVHLDVVAVEPVSAAALQPPALCSHVPHSFFAQIAPKHLWGLLPTTFLSHSMLYRLLAFTLWGAVSRAAVLVCGQAITTLLVDQLLRKWYRGSLQVRVTDIASLTAVSESASLQ